MAQCSPSSSSQLSVTQQLHIFTETGLSLFKNADKFSVRAKLASVNTNNGRCVKFQYDFNVKDLRELCQLS